MRVPNENGNGPDTWPERQTRDGLYKFSTGSREIEGGHEVDQSDDGGMTSPRSWEVRGREKLKKEMSGEV